MTRNRLLIYVPLAVLALSALACSAGLLATPTVATTPALPPTGTPIPAPPATPVPISSPQVIVVEPAAEEALLVQLYQRISPGVVAIRVSSTTDDRSLGSGFVYDAQGHIVTNYHVIEGANQIEVDFASGLKVRGTVIGEDPDSDLAVVKVDVPPEDLVALELGDSDAVMVGQRVIAIGNPFGLEGTMTIGIISGLGRTLESQHAAPGGGFFSAPDVLQTDAAINPGNSGGPLLNLQGQVVGVNRAIESETGVNSGVGFAVAANTVRRVVPHLIAEGKYDSPYLGITSLSRLTLTDQELLNLPRSTGVYVTSVSPNGPADRAGLRAGSRPTSDPNLRAGGDLIIAIDDNEVREFNDLLSYLINHTEVGQTVTLTVIRDGQTLELPVTLASRP